jgi:hypothetical protein
MAERRVLRSEHPSTLYSTDTPANVYRSQGNYAQAEALYSRTIEIQRRVSGPEHPNTVRFMYTPGVVYYSDGKYAQAEELFSQTCFLRIASNPVLRGPRLQRSSC